MSTTLSNPLFTCKPIQGMGDTAVGEHSFKRTLGPLSLVALGIGAIIGAGIFSLTGIAAADNAGPAVVLSFLIAAAGCGFAGLCYSELSSMIPAAGSAYTYAYASLGELVAWIIGWALTLEYAVGAATVSVSWSAYVTQFLGSLGAGFAACADRFAVRYRCQWAMRRQAWSICRPSLSFVCVSLLLIRGISESAKVNAAIVALKLAVVLAVIGFGAFYVDTANWHPFIPPNTGTFGHFGISGVLRGAGTVFFAYIGFDAGLHRPPQETKNPEARHAHRHPGIARHLPPCSTFSCASWSPA